MKPTHSEHKSAKEAEYRKKHNLPPAKSQPIDPILAASMQGPSMGLCQPGEAPPVIPSK